MIDDVAAVDNITLSTVTFDLADKRESNKKARAEAFAEAKSKAKEFAELSGLTLGKAKFI